MAKPKYRKIRRNGQWITVDENGKEVKVGQGQLGDLLREGKRKASQFGQNLVYSDKTDDKGRPLTVAQATTVRPGCLRVHWITRIVQLTAIVLPVADLKVQHVTGVMDMEHKATNQAKVTVARGVTRQIKKILPHSLLLVAVTIPVLLLGASLSADLEPKDR